MPQVDPDGQHDRFLAAGWQHAFTAGMEDVTRSLAGVVGVREGVVQPQARAGTAAPIMVETASKRQTSGRTFRALDMVESYTRRSMPVNPDYPCGSPPLHGPESRAGKKAPPTPSSSNVRATGQTPLPKGVSTDCGQRQVGGRLVQS